MPFKFGIDFELLYYLPWVVANVITSIESVVVLTAVAEISGEPVSGQIHRDRLSKKILADVVGNLITAIFISMPNTTFSQKVGVSQMTKVDSRLVGYVVAGILILLVNRI